MQNQGKREQQQKKQRKKWRSDILNLIRKEFEKRSIVLRKKPDNKFTEHQHEHELWFTSLSLSQTNMGVGNSPGKQCTLYCCWPGHCMRNLVWVLYCMSSWRALSSCDLLECSPPEDPNLSPLFTPYIKRGNAVVGIVFLLPFPLLTLVRIFTVIFISERLGKY